MACEHTFVPFPTPRARRRSENLPAKLSLWLEKFPPQCLYREWFSLFCCCLNRTSLSSLTSSFTHPNNGRRRTNRGGELSSCLWTLRSQIVVQKQMSASTKGIVNQNRNRRVVIAIHAFNGTFRRWQWEDDLLHFSTIFSPATRPFVLPPNYRTIAGRMVLSLSWHERDSKARGFVFDFPSLTARQRRKGKEKRTNNAWNCHKWSRFWLPFIKLLLLEAVFPIHSRSRAMICVLLISI